MNKTYLDATTSFPPPPKPDENLESVTLALQQELEQCRQREIGYLMWHDNHGKGTEDTKLGEVYRRTCHLNALQRYESALERIGIGYEHNNTW